jgi:RNA polymerase sigma-70 factor (ECF subfamily)
MEKTFDLEIVGPDPDDGLVAQAKSGDTSAFGVLFQRHRAFVYNVCYRMLGSVDDAVDITQTVFLQAYSHIRRFRGDSGFRTWLYRIAVNSSTEYLRREQRRRRLAANLVYALPETKSPDNQVWETILRLPEDLRAILVLFYYEELACTEIAEVLGCSEGAVRTRLHRARIAFKSKFGADL